MFQLTSLPRTLEAAIRDASDKKIAVRVSALADLARLAEGPSRPRALAALERALIEDTSPTVRAEAAVRLADAGAGESLDALLESVNDADRAVRQMAIVALGEVATSRDPRALDAVRAALDEEAPALRYQSLLAFFRLDPEQARAKVLAATGDPDAQVRHLSFRLLEEACFPDEGGGAAAVAADVVDACRRALEDASFSVRLVAAVLLARAGDLAGRAVLVRAIERADDADPEDVQSAIELAGEHRLAEARLALSRRAFGVLAPARDPFAWHSRVALARLGDERAKQSILKGLSAFTRDTRTLAVAAAGQAGLVEAHERIEKMRGDARSAEPQAVHEALRLIERARRSTGL